jgi:putative membrane protein
VPDTGPPRRRPHAVYETGPDPDPRFSLANERTYLAWTRTALALVAAAVAANAPALGLTDAASLVLSITLLVLAGVCLYQGTSRWRRTEVAMRTGGSLPGFGGALLLAAGSWLLIGVALAWVVGLF